MNKWLAISESESAIGISTRIRLARNLVAYPFPGRMTQSQRVAMTEAVRDAILNSNSLISNEFYFVNVADIGENQRISLVERHLVSPEFISDPINRGLILSKDEKVSIMIGEEDHIRIQVISDSTEDAFEIADRIDILLSERLRVAYDHRLGYLTQCPTNLGTGMRVSAMLHLPALTETGAISRIAASLTKLGIAVRGTYGEGSEVMGCLYQVSNQITLGLSESEAIENLSGIARQLMEEEKKIETEMVKNILIQDKISRALGIIKSAKLLTCKEFMGLISLIRLGVSTGIIRGVSGKEISALTADVQPATILVNNKVSDVRESDACRAKIAKEKLLNAE